MHTFLISAVASRAAETLEVARQLIREAIEFHIEGMRINGDAIPELTPHVEQVEVFRG